MAIVTEQPTVVSEPPTEVGLGDERFAISSKMFAEMVDAGLIPRDCRVFLREGGLYEKMAKTKAHAAIQDGVAGALWRRIPPGFSVGIEHPVELDEKNLPLPDTVVLKGQSVDYLDRYPGADDVLLVVEVAVTSLPRDLGPRLAQFARALPQATYVVVDVANRRVLVHRGPGADPPGYAEVETVGPGQVIRLSVGGVDLQPIPFEDVMR
jgi:methylaspartate ammonia-lyase